MTEETQYLTKEKFEELKRELQELKTVKRKEIAENLEYAKSLGDLSENAEYQQAREQQANLEERIMKIEGILKSPEIVSFHHSEVVGIGSIAHVQKEKDKTSCKYKIVGSEEANMAEGKLSNQSPLGKALIGKKKGETFKFKTPKGEVEYTILKIE